MLQIAALCYRERAGELEVLLVLSRGGGNWIIPKGWPIRGKSSPETAEIEAFEEAGVSGTVSAEAIGTYHYSKSLGTGLSLPCIASAYSIEVDAEADEFPEKDQRQKAWLPVADAAARVSSPELATLLQDFRN